MNINLDETETPGEVNPDIKVDELPIKDFKIKPITKIIGAATVETNFENPTNELDNLGVKDTKEFLQLLAAGFDSVYEATKTDGKIDFPGDFVNIAMKTSMKVIPAFSGISNIPREILFDKVSEADIDELVSAFDECKNLKGDTRDAIKDLLPIVAGIANWRLKYFGSK